MFEKANISISNSSFEDLKMTFLGSEIHILSSKFERLADSIKIINSDFFLNSSEISNNQFGGI